jgi:hypothetical protein
MEASLRTICTPPARRGPAKRASKPELKPTVAKSGTKKLGRPASNAKTLKQTYAEAVTGVAGVEDKFDSSSSLSDNVPFSTVSLEDHVEPTVSVETSPTVHEEHETSFIDNQPTELEFTPSIEELLRLASLEAALAAAEGKLAKNQALKTKRRESRVNKRKESDADILLIESDPPTTPI